MGRDLNTFLTIKILGVLLPSAFFKIWEILEINKKIYHQSDPKINKLWKETRQWSLDYFDKIYKRVYTHFDRLYFEGEVAKAGKKIVLQAMKKGLSVGRQGI